ncbi:hypothetical protein FOQG_17658 [Fusarium oxysporum f. sp. raphani 54005]|uniref:Uncharacterized protein n=2 Tax=Fusarium oxysporum TaxID=5507 RepID=X0BFM9_FUSOX|nr:hypothetical protein FOVG_17128 [Fusarium oxysporum f. sp. pisi HDV247]EXK77638.1 hypothetical protein FOQG_17658 [Fusarium oxysporum f. sp. raphani 54005]KAI3573254.1 hypothetical protein IWW34DRAFT_757777 [Fusarium oxysporum f. sp. albedinis]KAJ0131799.1 Uncharacterized protein HZ326_25108 [Fusarium oxysporum f. sp. albedinis]KAK2469721.1 hypothetical protein H9L39_18536 [Fusarium oxysporum f. sp. albedinis]
MAATSCTFKPAEVPESHIQLIIQELRDMDRTVRSAVKHQQMAVEASLVEWRRKRNELSTITNNKKPMDETVPNN